MILYTENLTLTYIEKEHNTLVFNNFTRDIADYLYIIPPDDISQTDAFIADCIKKRSEKTDYVFAIFLKETNEFIGLTGIHKLKNEPAVLGIWTKKSAHGNYYGRQAIGALIKHAKEIGVSKLMYHVDERNAPSKKIPIYYGGVLIEKNVVVKTPDGRELIEEIYEIKLDKF